MKRRLTKLKHVWPIVVLVLVELVIFSTNYTPGTYLMGWDNVMPEFNFKANFLRSLFGVWQEHRGLGLYDGMSHIALILHTFVIWIFSFILPKSLVRYAFNFLMHLLGGIGMYFLLRLITNKQSTVHNQKYAIYNLQLIPLLGSLFYLLNIATIQMFFTPLEVFTVHFAGLPWLVLTLTQYLNSGSRRSLGFFITAVFLTTPQHYVPTLFITVLLVLSIFIATHVLTIRNRASFKKGVVAFVTFLLVNAFWLLPYIYGLPQNAPIIKSAKINLMSSNEIFARNQAFGDIKNVLLLRGFGLDFVETNKDGATSFMMQVWRNHIDSPLVLAISVIFIGVMFWGILTSLKSLRQGPPQWAKLAFLLTIGVSFLLLATDVPILNWLTLSLRTIVPFFDEAFRFSFTKFGLLFCFTFTIFLSLGLYDLFLRFKPQYVKTVVFLVSLYSIVIYALPAFQGHFISDYMRVKLPSEYEDMFAYMRKVDPDQRVAILPQPEFWSWKHYRYGYVGSGFLWYGLAQPLMDRAFDPWSNENENYYWELSHSIYSKDAQALDKVFQKYGVRYIIIDDNLTISSHSKGLFRDEIDQLLASNPNIELRQEFGTLRIFERIDPDFNSFVGLYKDLPVISSVYDWTDNDMAFNQNGPYISEIHNDLSDVYYPSRALFTKRSVDERVFSAQESEQEIKVSVSIDSTLNSWPIPEATDASKTSLTSTGVEVKINKKEGLLSEANTSNSLVASAVIPCNPLKQGKSYAVNENDQQQSWLRLFATGQRGCLSFGMNNLEHSQGYLVAVKSKHVTGEPLRFSLINQTAKHTELETFLPTSTEWTMSYFILPPLAEDGLGYDVYLINDSPGKHESVNDLSYIRVYPIPYDYLTTLKLTQPMFSNINSNEELPLQTGTRVETNKIQVDHPNPAEYWVKINNPESLNDTTLVLSQSFNPGWQAWVKTAKFPYFSRLNDHILVNNWANGWRLKSSDFSLQTSDNQTTDDSRLMTVYIVFWPQILEFIGFGLLLLPLFLLTKKQG